MKKLSLIVAAAMCISLLAACGGSKPAETTKAPETTAASAETKAAETTAAPETTAAVVVETEAVFEKNFKKVVKQTDWYEPANEEAAANWFLENYPDDTTEFTDENQITTVMSKIGNDKDAFLGVCVIYNDPEVWPTYIALRDAAYDDYEALDTVQIDIQKDYIGITKTFGDVDPDIEMQMSFEILALYEDGVDLQIYEDGDDSSKLVDEMKYLDKDETLGLIKKVMDDKDLNEAASKFVDLESLYKYIESVFAHFGK